MSSAEAPFMDTQAKAKITKASNGAATTGAGIYANPFAAPGGKAFTEEELELFRERASGPDVGLLESFQEKLGPSSGPQYGTIKSITTTTKGGRGGPPKTTTSQQFVKATAEQQATIDQANKYIADVRAAREEYKRYLEVMKERPGWGANAGRATLLG